jgi:HEAT repeat protein
VLALGLVAGAIAFGVAFALSRGLVTNLLRGDKIADADWQEVAPPGEKFRILMPGSPRQEQKTAGTTSLQQYTVERDRGRISFVLLFGNLTDADLRAIPWERRFQLALQLMLGAEAGARLKSEKALTLDGHVGREFVVEIPKKGNALTRIYGVRQGGRNLYLTLIAAGPDYGPESPPVAKFFDSLRLEKESPAQIGKQLAEAPAGKRVELVAELRKKGAAAQEAVPVLTEVVKDTRDYMACIAAAELLGDLGPAAAPAVPALAAVLKTQHPRKTAADNGNIRVQVAGALARIDPKDAFAREVLRDCTKDPNGSVRITAHYYLLKLDPAGNAADLDELIRIWQAGGWERDDAAKALGKLGPQAAKAVPVLIEAVGGKDDPRRRSAISLLGALGPSARDALPALRALDAPPSPEDLRQAVRDACKKIEGTS